MSSAKYKLLKVGVFAFTIVGQIAGGYFTDPLIWIAYGIILSKENKKLGNEKYNIDTMDV